MQVISFELSKKLEELGITRHSRFKYGVCFEDDTILSANIIDKKLYNNSVVYSLKEVYPAYSLDEILELLPFSIDNRKISDNYYFLLMGKRPENKVITYVCGYDDIQTDTCLHSVLNQNPAEAAGQLLVWCIENGYVEINK
jgi:hypothetical protein